MLIFLSFNSVINADDAIFYKVNTNDVRIRESNSFESKVIGKLQAGDKITILAKTNNFVISDKYYGRWLKIKLNDTTGFVLSCFIDLPNEKHEKFHTFVDDFFESANGKDAYKYYISRIKFPFEIYEFTTMSSATKYYKSINDFPKFYRSKEMWSYIDKDKREVSLENDIITVYYRCDGCGVSQRWHFKLINNKWYCVKITRSDC